MNILEAVLLLTLWSKYDNQLAKQSQSDPATNKEQTRTAELIKVNKPTGPELLSEWNGFKVDCGR